MPLPERNGILLNLLRHEGGRWFMLDSQNIDMIEGIASKPLCWCD
jgi:hypothetical protein